MDIKQNETLTKWQKACLVVTIVFSIPYVIVLFQRPAFIPGDAALVLPAFIILLATWCPLIFYWIGLLATSSLSSSALSLAYFGVVLLTVLTPEYPKWASAWFLIVAIFYYLYSTKTWQLYEVFWFEKMKTISQVS